MRRNKLMTVIFLLVMGAAALGIGAKDIFFAPKDLVQTTATITRIEEEIDPAGEGDEKDYTAYVDYTVDGTAYKDVRLNYFDPSYKVGKKVKIFYRASDPSSISGDSKGFSIYLMVAGGVCLLAAVVVFIRP